MSGAMSFDETMSGFYSFGSNEPSRGFRLGRQQNHAVQVALRISINDVDEFVRDAAHEAELDGVLTAVGLGEDLEITKGRFNLFRRGGTGVRYMMYRFGFESAGEEFFFDGRKEILDDPSALDAIEDMTTLYTRILRGTSPTAKDVAGAGILRFHLRNLPLLVTSIQTPGSNAIERLRIVHKFFGFAFGELAQTYLFGLK